MRLHAILRKIPLLGKKLDRMLILESGLFDAGYYQERYPDITSDPLGHYLEHGAFERRDPSPYFRTGYYLDENPDVTAAGINPLVHFILWGALEGRDPSPYFDCSYYLETNADVRDSGVNPLAHFILHGKNEGREPLPCKKSDRMLILESCLFDAGYYQERYPDITSDPLGHYLEHGAFERRDPSPYFRTGYYLDENPDVTAAGINPLVHFILWGALEGRDPSPYFDCSYYLETNADVRDSGVNPLAHFILHGENEGREPLPCKKSDRMLILESCLFDAGYYQERYPDITSDPLGHYLEHGAFERRDPSPYFRTGYYLDENPDVAAAGINPLVHFILWGALEGRDPNPYFDCSYYLETNADVRDSGVNPLAHFLMRGRREGRDPCPRSGPRVHLYATCWNEIRLLDFFFRHYDNIVQRYVIFDEGSTDGSIDLLRGHPKVELRRFVRNDPDSFVTSELDLFNNCWKESRGFRGTPVADWVIICNIDEHLFHPDLGGYLSECLEAGITAIPALGCQMLVKEFPQSGERLCNTQTSALPDPTDCKLIVFSPTAIKDINYETGGHAAKPTGQVVAPARDELLLLNYQILGTEYTLERFAELRSGLGPSDHARGWGFHYAWTSNDLQQMFDKLPEKGINALDISAKTWKIFPRPEWWLGFHRRLIHPPLLSIVTTVYDRVEELESCIKSVRNLNFQDYEHIIVADHPPQDIFLKLETVVTKTNDTRISLYNMPGRTNNWGISPAEFGLRKARGRYISFLDDDNAYFPNHFDLLIDYLEYDQGAGFAYSSCLWNNEHVLKYSPPAFCQIDLGQIVFRRDTFRNCFNDELNYSGYDWDWFLISDLMSRGVSYKHIDLETFIFRLKKYPQFIPV